MPPPFPTRRSSDCQFDRVVLLPALDPLVVVVDGHRQRTLGAGLADHVLVEDFQDLLRLGQRAARRLGLLLELLADDVVRSEEHTSELQSLMRISYAVFCLKKKNSTDYIITITDTHQIAL